ncbi:MAG: type IX secretion system protein PorQ [Muribaculaceae bacterium]|nr:type IX secretion system protein PorQ [Muribaculaceae bacterium]
MRVKSYITALAILIFSLPIMAQDGSSAYQFLNIPASTHIYGLGGVNISTVVDDISITDQNPALLGAEMDKQLALNYMHYLGESNFAGIKYGAKAHDRGAWAVGLQYLGYGEMQSADIDGTITGTFTAKDIVFNAMYSHDITDRLRGGINLKYVYSAYEDYSAMALATDLGINYYDPEKDMSLSFVVANLGGQIKRFNESYDRLPIDVRLGWTQSFGTLPFRFSITAWNLTEWELPYYETGDGTTNEAPELKESFKSNLFRHLIFAADFVPSDRFHIGVGYNYKTRTDMSTYSRNFFSGFSVSAGINVKRFGIGVALSQPHSGATTFMFNLTANINEFLH